MPGIAVAGLGAILIALLGAILVYAVAQLLRPVIEGFLGRLPVVGPWILDREVDLMVGVWNAGRRAWDVAVGPLTDFIQVWHWAFWNLADNYVRAIEASLAAVWRVKNWTIPWYFGKASEYTQQLHAQAISYAQDLHAQAVSYAVALHGQALIYAAALHAQAVDYAQRLHAQAVSYAAALHAQGVDYAQRLHAQAISYAQDLHAQALEYARALQAQALGFAEDAFGRAIEFERRLYGEGLRYSQQVGAQVQDYARALSERDVAYTAAAVGAVAVRLARIESSKCQRFCNPLGDLGSELQDLSGLFDAGLLLALAAEAVHDPHGFARGVSEDLGKVATAAATDVRAGVGV